MSPDTAFLDWQCRLRKRAMRREGGRPAPGMRPRVTRAEGSELASAITVLLLEKTPGPSTDMFRHIIRKTADPRERLEAGLRILSGFYFQYPTNFTDVMTALFSAESGVGKILVKEGRCMLQFHQDAEDYGLQCTVIELDEESQAFQATYWHNHLFNAQPPAEVRVLAFYPQWALASMAS